MKANKNARHNAATINLAKSFNIRTAGRTIEEVAKLVNLALHTIERQAATGLA